jgi:hypothetical protein
MIRIWEYIIIILLGVLAPFLGEQASSLPLLSWCLNLRNLSQSLNDWAFLVKIYVKMEIL